MGEMMFMENKAHCQQGVTLVELLIALTVFAVGLLAIAGMQVTSIRANLNSNIRSTAIAAGQGALEDLTVRPESDAIFNQPGPNTGTIAISVADGDASVTYNANYTVTHDTPINKMAKIDIQIVSAWDNRARYSLTSYKRTE
jgi:type IV pilus assembly protein PilV